jgi:hypothetical protein
MSHAQDIEPSSGYSIDGSYFYGTLLRHSKDVAHLVNGHPEGFALSYNRQTFGASRWERSFNYPDYGATFMYHNGKDKNLGDTYGLYGHYNFYFFNRHLVFRVGQGIAYATNPFDLETNFKNNAYGTRLLAATFLKLNYKFNISQHLSSQMGMQLIHFSNGNLKAPNSSTNTFAFNIGLQYDLVAHSEKRYLQIEEAAFGHRPISFDLQLRGGLNESDFVGLGQHPFFVFTALAEKRLSFFSSIQLGAEYFHATFLKKEIEFLEVAFPNRLEDDDDFRRVGIFAGYQLHINRLSVYGQFGYYVHYPYDFEGRFYQRLGLSYALSERWYGLTAIKSHGAKAEAVEFGVGYKMWK